MFNTFVFLFIVVIGQSYRALSQEMVSELLLTNLFCWHSLIDFLVLITIGAVHCWFSLILRSTVFSGAQACFTLDAPCVASLYSSSGVAAAPRTC